MKEPRKYKELSVYLILRAFVIFTMIRQFFIGNWENVFVCILTLILFLIPIIIDRKFNIKLPSTLEKIIYFFIFGAEILGEIQNFYGIFEYWDVILHTLNGFIAAAIGFSLIDIINNSNRFFTKMSPSFVALVSICFSMTIGVCWEFFEFGMDKYFSLDMQKDTISSKISSVAINEDKKNKPVILNNISKTVIYSKDKDGKEVKTVVEDGFLDLGIKDTMDDLWVNFVGAVTFSILGYFYIADKEKYKFTESFMPTKKTEEEIQKTKEEDEKMIKEYKEKKQERRNKRKAKKQK